VIFKVFGLRCECASLVARYNMLLVGAECCQVNVVDKTSKDSETTPIQMCLADDAETQVYDDMPVCEGFDGVVEDEEMMTMQYDLEPVTDNAKSAESKEESPALDDMPTQVMNEVDQRLGGKRGSVEAASQSSSLADAATQVFTTCSRSQSNSQDYVEATQTLNAFTNSRQSNSQTDLLATQVFDAVGTSRRNSGGFPTSNSQAEPATQVFDELPTTQQKSDSQRSNSHTDLLPTQVFCEPAAVAVTKRRSGPSPQQSTQTFSANAVPVRTSSTGADGSRMSFSPHTCSTQVLGETDFPHLSLEMSECNDSHDDSCGAKPTKGHTSLQQVFSLSRCLCAFVLASESRRGLATLPPM